MFVFPNPVQKSMKTFLHPVVALLVSAAATVSPVLAQAPVETAASATQSAPAAGSIAHFRFDGNAADAHAGNRPFALKNTEFRDGALYLNGKYVSNEKDGYETICVTPKLDYNKFTVALRFKAEAYDGKFPTLLMGGMAMRWFGLARTPSGNLVVTLNNSRFNHELKSVPLQPGAWTVIACAVDVPAHKISVAVNGKIAEAFDLPSDFKVNHTAGKFDDNAWTFTDYSSGGTFHGLIDEFIIYGEALSPEALLKIPLAP